MIQDKLGPLEQFTINQFSRMSCNKCHEEIGSWNTGKLSSNQMKQLKRDHRRTCK